MRTILKILVIVILVFTNSYAQLSHTFTQTAYIDINDEDENIYVAVGPDGTIFVAYSDSLFAYNYDGSSLLNTAKIDIPPEVESFEIDIDVGTDGTVFLANGSDGLRAYSYDGASFTNTAHINEGSGASGVAIWSDRTVFLADEGDGLRAYSYNGNSFTNMAHIAPNEIWGETASGVVADTVGKSVFLLYSCCRPETYLFMSAHSFDGESFTEIYDADVVTDIAVGPDGTLFIIDESLYAYIYDSDSLTNTAVIDVGNEEYQRANIAVSPEGTVFVANNIGLFAYTYSLATAIADEFTQIPQKLELYQNFPNPFNPSTTIEFDLPKSSDAKIEVYNITGQKIETLLNDKMPAGSHQVEFNAQNLSSGIYFYRIEVGDPARRTGEFQDVKKMILIR